MSLLSYEFQAYKQGYSLVGGVDEVGRGCWAGPLCVAICVLKPGYDNKEINDSKKLDEKTRERLFNVIIENSIYYKIEFLSSQDIDKEHNIKKSTIRLMEKLIEQAYKDIDLKYVLIDAEKVKVNNNIKTLSIIKGDAKSLSIAAASILAKVSRDRILIDMAKKYPQYKFDKNKGYGTKDHIDALNKYGIIKGFHRESYKPIEKIVKNEIKKNRN